MPLEAAAATRRMGQSVIRRLANARMVPDATSGPVVDGIFGRLPLDAPAGTAGMQSEDLAFRASTADLPADMQRGTVVRVYWDDQLVQLAGRYAVRDRDDSFRPGITLLDFELA